MALKNRDANRQYLKIKDGKFYIGKDESQSYDELEGRIVNMRYKDEEYEGTPLRKLVLSIQDGEDLYELGINVENSNYSSLVSFLKGVDINRVLTLHPKLDNTNKDGKEVARRSILVSQDGKYAKGYFTKDNKHGLPEWNIVKVGNKKVTDKTEYLAFLEKFVTENFIDKINAGSGSVLRNEEVSEPKVEVQTDADKLPWDED